VRTAYFREMADAAETITTLACVTREGFIPHIEEVCRVIHALLMERTRSLQAHFLTDNVLEKCSEVWGEVVQILAKKSPNLCKKFLVTYCEAQMKALQEEKDDPEMVKLHARTAVVASKPVAPLFLCLFSFLLFVEIIYTIKCM
jgi:hypothetical protein